MKKLLTVQDISCVGKCSLTVALPIISSMGVECQILPTSLLSTHTAFKSYSFLDLTDEMNVILNEFDKNVIRDYANYGKSYFDGRFKALPNVSDFSLE